MLTRGGDFVARRKVLDNLDVGHEPGARKDSLEQIVAEQRALGRATRERSLERVDVVDAFAGIGALAEEILVHVGHRGGIRVDAGRARDDALKERCLAAHRQ